MFEYQTQIFLHHTDAAGRLFFASQFYFIHEANEKFLESLGFTLQELLNHPRVHFPIVHAEADYKAVLVAGDKIRIDVAIEKIGQTSVVFAYMVHKADGTFAGSAKTVSVSVDRAAGQKTTIPDEWLKKLTGAVK